MIPPPPRSAEDNGLKKAFRKVFGFDPFHDPDPRWVFPPKRRSPRPKPGA